MTDIKPVKDEGDTIPFYPDHVITEAKVVLGIVILAFIIGIIGTFAPVGVEEPANPLLTPAHVKPEWYFLALYQMLKYVPQTFGVVSIVLAVVIAALWPFIDRKKETTTKARNIRFVITVIGVIVVIGMTIWGGM
jgi:quinol-cytochrome oxidoreductase complex cytochrome b subunit